MHSRVPSTMAEETRGFHLKVGQANLHGACLSGAELASAAGSMRLDLVFVQEPFTTTFPSGRVIRHVQTLSVRVALGKVDQETGLANTAIVVPNGALDCMVLDQLGQGPVYIELGRILAGVTNHQEVSLAAVEVYVAIDGIKNNKAPDTTTSRVLR